MSTKPGRVLVRLVPLALLVATGGFGRCGEESFRLVWEDDFDGAAGAPPDPASWSYDIGTGTNGWGNSELQFYRQENVAQDGAGNLVITARAESFGGRAHTSSRITTKGKREYQRGRFEARMKLPAGQGIWPAFWMLGGNIDTVPWPGCGEIDVMEMRGQEPETILGSLHGPGYSGGGAISEATSLPDGARFDDDFHVFSVEWDDQFIAWSVDGDTYSVKTPGQLPDGGTWVFDHPFFLILNVAVGGNFVGAPNASTMFPQEMKVDYVRVYEAGE